MIDKPYQVTPEALRQEANNLEYTGRQHYADIMRWAADKIEQLENANNWYSYSRRMLRGRCNELENTSKWLDNEYSMLLDRCNVLESKLKEDDDAML